MQFSVLNQCDYGFGVFHSNILYTPKQLSKIIAPQDVLKKTINDHAWRNDHTDDWINRIRQNTQPYLQFSGFATPSNSVDIYNLTRVPQYLYVFYIRLTDKKVTLWYHLVDARNYFSQYDYMAVYQFTISVHNAPSPRIVAESDENTGTLFIKYYDPGMQLDQQNVDWIPPTLTTGDEWKFPLITLLLIIIMIVGIIIAFAALYRGATHVTKNYTNNITEKRDIEPNYLS